MTRGRLAGLAAVLVGLVAVVVVYMVALRNSVTTGDFPRGWRFGTAPL